MATNARMISQLRALLQLTQSEVQIARIRVGQARTEAVRRELNENADNAERRAADITRGLQRLGGVADVVSPLVGRVGAFVKGTVEQAGPVDEALLGDLALEHQLVERARYLRSLAEAAHDEQTGKLADRLVTAHSATVEWLTTVLAEEALGGPPALRATPMQLVAGGVTRAVNYPVQMAREQVNRVVSNVSQGGGEVRHRVSQAADKAAHFSDNARDVVLTGRDAAINRAEEVARREGDRDTAQSLHEARTRLGTLQESELPITDYDRLGVNDAVAAIKKLDDIEDINKVVHYEEANKNRHGVVSAAQTRHAALAKDVAGVQ